MAEKKDETPEQPQPQAVVIAPNLQQAPGPTEGMLQPVDAAKDPNAKPVYLVNGVLVDPDGNQVKGK
jgi:hypothetical protein